MFAPLMLVCVVCSACGDWLLLQACLYAPSSSWLQQQLTASSYTPSLTPHQQQSQSSPPQPQGPMYSCWHLPSRWEDGPLRAVHQPPCHPCRQQPAHKTCAGLGQAQQQPRQQQQPRTSLTHRRSRTTQIRSTSRSACQCSSRHHKAVPLLTPARYHRATQWACWHPHQHCRAARGESPT